MREGRTPAYIGDDGPLLVSFGQFNYLWGNIPAIDVLNIGQNEGLDYGGDLDLCFAGEWEVEAAEDVLPSLRSAETECDKLLWLSFSFPSQVEEGSLCSGSVAENLNC